MAAPRSIRAASIVSTGQEAVVGWESSMPSRPSSTQISTSHGRRAFAPVAVAGVSSQGSSGMASST